MLQHFRNWMDGEPERLHPATPAYWVPQPTLSSKPRSVLTHETTYGRTFDNEFITPPDGDPRVLFPMLRWMREHIPDVSAGVWAWVRVCNTTLRHEIKGSDDPSEAETQLRHLDRCLFSSVGEQNRSIESLIQTFFLSIFTYGAFAGEVITDPYNGGLERFLVIDPATVRFRLDENTGRYLPCQLLPDNNVIELNDASFFYFGLDTDGLSPYGRSPLMALPMVIQAQQQILRDMEKTQRNAGYPLLHFRLKQSARESGESNHEYAKRLHEEIDTARTTIGERRPEHNLVTYDNVQVEYLSANGDTTRWTESLQAISEQVISALHLAPFMLGRNWGTTQSWGNAQYQLITNNARTVQHGALRLADWLRNLHLSMLGIHATVEHHFEPHHLMDLGDRAKAFRDFSSSLVRLKENGLLEESEAKQKLDSLYRYL